ncbi:MAG: hypothetical protein H6560_10645 [Lewinellaceae bacterium]|nr:hypothetical protein [Lewinellaceae bacterium]
MQDASDDNQKHPLIRDGVSQRQRMAPALDPSLVKVDERTVEDFLVFALEFSRQLLYHNHDPRMQSGSGSDLHDWEPFWNRDPSVVIASIQKTNPLIEKEAFYAALDEPATPGQLASLIQLLYALIEKTDTWLKRLTVEPDFRSRLSRMVAANLQRLVPTLVAVEKGAAIVFDGLYPFPDKRSLEQKRLSGEWLPAGFSFDAVEPNTGIFNVFRTEALSGNLLLAPNPSEEERLQAVHEPLAKLFTEAYNIYFQAIQLAPAYFRQTLELRDHEPHVALFISFLKLYALLQEDLNRMAQRHLDFFYREVLQLKEKPLKPDHVHLFFELARQVDEHELKGQLRFVAGADDTGQERFYTLDEDIVLNKAAPELFRTVYIDRKEGVIENVYAAPVANSEDGLGAEIEDEEKPSWKTLGGPAMPPVEIGFVVASREMLLGDGARKITLTLQMTGAELLPAGSDISSSFDVFLSGAEGWIDSTQLQSFTVEQSAGSLIFRISLGTEAPAVAPFDAETLGEQLGTSLPVLKILLRQPPPEGLPFAYHYFRQAQVDNIILETAVIGHSNLSLFSDLGPIDPTKPFQPFGPQPIVGSGFYIGSSEAGQKYLDTADLVLEWEQVPENFTDYYHGYVKGGLDDVVGAGDADNEDPMRDEFVYRAKVIRAEGEEALLNPEEKWKLFVSGNEVEVEVLETIGQRQALRSVTSWEAGKLARSLDEEHLADFGLLPGPGFVQLNLLRDFEHDLYPSALARQMIAKGKYPTSIVSDAVYLDPDATPPGEPVIPREPYTPSIRSASMNYSTRADARVAAQSLQFIHLHPFENTYEVLDSAIGNRLLPVLHENESKSGEGANVEGSLCIGLRGLKPKQSLSLLFQAAENTGDTEADEPKVHWQYLAGNRWVDFREEQVVQDTTKGLITSGIVVFAIPKEIALGNTILPGDLHWIRAYVAENSSVISEMINIHAQAVRATFQDNGNSLNHLAQPLPAESIAGLEAEDPALDSVNQLYPSFGGRPPESSLAFYTRISERLRHKGRAITLFDYERLVLDAFDDIYKVKCISHTRDGNVRAPGHVMVAIVPDFTKLKAVNRKEPKATRGRLREIRDYLGGLNTPFVGANQDWLHVVNPDYQRIVVDFRVRFRPDVTAVEFHKTKLKESIVRFLSPWSYDDGAEISFGGRAFKSSILDFVESQPYVDYVTEFRMMEQGTSDDVDVIEAATPRSVLAPAPVSEMMVREITDGQHCQPENPVFRDTLGYQTLGSGFEPEDNNEQD